MLQRSAEWNRTRATSVTASGCSAVLDLSPWISRKDYLEQKAFESVYGVGPRPSNVAMEDGILWEPAVIEMSKPFVLGFNPNLYYADNSGKAVNGVSTEYQRHPEIPFLGASPDKLVYDRSVAVPVQRQDGLFDYRDLLVSGLEVKKQFRMSKRGPEAWFPCKEVVYNYWCQCQLSMEVFDVPHWDFFVVGQQITSDETLPDGSPSHVAAWSQGERVYRDKQWFEDSLVEFVKFMDELEATIAELKASETGGEPCPTIPIMPAPEVSRAAHIEGEWDGVIEDEEWDGVIEDI